MRFTKSLIAAAALSAGYAMAATPVARIAISSGASASGNILEIDAAFAGTINAQATSRNGSTNQVLDHRTVANFGIGTITGYDENMLVLEGTGQNRALRSQSAAAA